jgi:hypothetical protein
MPWIVPSEESICGPGSQSEVKVVRNADEEFKFKTLVVQGLLLKIINILTCGG